THGGAAAGPGRGDVRRRGKATLGSTSYDDAGPFEPDWAGASWYGTTSGTYWTVNPKEYADPRKHGPEYQARARRASRFGPSAEAPGEHRPDGPIDEDLAADGAPADHALGPDDPDGHQPAGPEATGSPGPTHTTASWWESTAASGTATGGAGA